MLLAAGTFLGEEILDGGDEWEEEIQDWVLDSDGTLMVSGTGDLYTGYWTDFDEKKHDVKKLVVNVTEAASIWIRGEDFPNLESLDLTGFDTSGLTDLSCAFLGLAKLKTIDFGNFNAANVIDMSGMFSGCIGFTSLDLSRWNTGKVTDLSDMFGNCSSLVSLNLKEWNTGNVTEIGNMFSGCNSLKEIDISYFNLSNIELSRDNTGKTYPIYILAA